MVKRIGMGEDKPGNIRMETGDRGTSDGDGHGEDKRVVGSADEKETSDGEQPGVRGRDYKEETSIRDRKEEDTEQVAGSQ